MKKYWVLVATLIALLCGCTNYRNVEITDVRLEKFKLVSASKSDLQLLVSVFNPTKSTFTVPDIQGILYRDDVKFATLSLQEEVVIPSLSTTRAIVKCRIDLLDPLAVLVMGLDIASWDADEFKIDMKVTVKGAGFRKNFKLANIPLSKVIKRIKIK